MPKSPVSNAWGARGAPLFAMMCGLKLPWHRRRTTRQVRDNFLYCGQLLKAAMGRGYYSYANFRSAPPVWTDASKSKAYTGGAPLAPQALETGDFGIVEPIL